MAASIVDSVRAGLLDHVEDGLLDRHAGLVAALLDSSIALVTVIGERDQHFVGRATSPDVQLPVRATPRRLSLCARVVEADGPLVVDDLAAHPELGDHPAQTELGVAAYAGVPLRIDGEAVGAVCAVGTAPRHWSERDVATLESLGAFVSAEVGHALHAQESDEAAEDLGLLVSSLRHEIGGEMAIVLSAIETAMLQELDPPAKDHVLATARRDAIHVMSTLDALLRADTRAPLDVERVELDHLLDGVVRMLRSPRHAHRIQIETAIGSVTTARVLLERIITNLLTNALKHTTGQVRVNAVRTGDEAVIEIADDGDGIPPDRLRQLFEPFSRGTRPDASGFGLGLYLVRRLTERLGGRLDVDTSRHGTTIEVRVPAEIDGQPDPR